MVPAGPSSACASRGSSMEVIRPIRYWRVNVAFALLVAFCTPVLRDGVRHRWVWVLLLLIVFPVLAAVLLVGRSARTGLRRHVAVGRADARRHRIVRHRGGVLAARDSAGVRPTLAIAGRADPIGRLHRGVARRPAVDRAVHVNRGGAAVPARGLFARSAAARDRGAGAVQCRLYGGGGARRSARRAIRARKKPPLSLGLRWWHAQAFIVLPQALRIIVPGHHQHRRRPVQGHHALDDHRPV